MKKVIVTGAGGFIGRQTLPSLLENGFEVHAISSRQNAAIDSNCYWHQINLLNFQEIKDLMSFVKPTHLLHFAWNTIPGKYWTTPDNFRWVQASLTLLEQFSRFNGQRVVMAGTCAEYDWQYGYCTEQITPTDPDTPYGICKDSLRKMLEAYSEQMGISSGWGRIFFPFGPFEHPKRLVPSVISSLLSGKQAQCSHGQQIRDFLYVKDIADAFVAFLLSDVSGAVNIASGKPVKIRQIADKIATMLNQTDKIQFGVIPTPKDEPPLIVGNVNRLIKEIGWQPNYTLDLGLELTIEWWQRNSQNLVS